ncbi:MAG: altronate dehydratase [Clostridia bacterium]|nr:altronate dehydratase [Clostridia bacterium]
MGNFVIHPDDTVEICLENGQKYARRRIEAGEAVIKYGYPIGKAVTDIEQGELVHSHNLKTLLDGVLEYTYTPKFRDRHVDSDETILAYVRENGQIGIRNDVWIINTVGCVNKTAEILSRETGAFAFPHPYGCSQLGEDSVRTMQILCGLIRHPNAGGVLVLGLGCENNNIDEMKKVLGDYDPRRIRFLNVQDCEDEIAEGKRIIGELQAICADDRREPVPVSRLVIGLKCGGSDGYSGITANPLAGRICDRHTAAGGSAVLTEVPEMFGAEQILMERCATREIFDKTVRLINDYKNYYIAHNQPVSENPSPGNRAGGITTLEEKSLGCVQKGGSAVVTDVLDYGDTVRKPGLNLLNGPGNDIVAITNLTAAGCHLILFTTGRGTPLGAPVPTLKIATNTALAGKKSHWIDFDAQQILERDCTDDLWQYIREVAEGKPSRNEQCGYREIAIFKDGVTL